MNIKHISGTTLFESDKETLKESLIDAIDSRANLYGANLSRADLRGADLRGANLSRANLRGAKIRDGIEIQRIPFQITTEKYHIIIFDEHIQIGCEFHKITDLMSFTDRQIIELDGKDALVWWNNWKVPIQAICKAEGRG